MEDAEQLRCPTCRATQEWSDTCRRCRSDLRLLRAFEDEYRDRRARCFSELRARNFQAALDNAYACVQLRANAESLELLAVCALFGGDWETALKLAELYSTRPHHG